MRTSAQPVPGFVSAADPVIQARPAVLTCLHASVMHILSVLQHSWQNSEFSCGKARSASMLVSIWHLHATRQWDMLTCLTQPTHAWPNL